MSSTRILLSVFLLSVIFSWQTSADESPRFSNSLCLPKSMKDSIVSFHVSVCPLNWIDSSFGALGVIEGDDASLQKALNMVHRNAQDYVVILFYASWCPFSTTFRPLLSSMSSLYPSVPHFAIEESVIRPSILSKYGVHGFPTLFVLNSTMHVRYHGSRTLDSLVVFYNNVTGIKHESVDETSMVESSDGNISWARSPENMLPHETYLTLATIFMVLRLFCPFMVACARVSWRRSFLNIGIKSLWEHPLNHAIQLLSFLKRSNLHGAMNAKAAWALVSFGEASTSHDGSGS